MDLKSLNETLFAHKKWLNHESDGKQANLSGCDLYDEEFNGDVLDEIIMCESNCIETHFDCADLKRAILRGCNFENASFNGADLTGADLGFSNLNGTDLSGAIGLLSSCDYMKEHFEQVPDGYIAYKTFGSEYDVPDYWEIKPGSVIQENVNPNRTCSCGCGINVATLKWVEENYSGDVWKVLIRWEWLPGVVVPYDTNGKIRCEKVELLEVVKTI